MAYDPKSPPPMNDTMAEALRRIGAQGAVYYGALVAGGVPVEVASKMLERYTHIMFDHLAQRIVERLAALATREREQ